MPLRGIAELPLHYGKMPRWLYAEMVKLAEAISKAIVFEYGRKEMLSRLSDPFWFQAFGCVLGFDWHSSGLTTTVMAALREAFLKAEVGLYVAGGKGKTSKKTPEHIEKYAEKIGMTDKKIEMLKLASKLIAKTDNVALQDSYELYHHTLIFDEDARYAVVQQGMNEFSSYARRYHWLYEDVSQRGFFNDVHKIITSFKLPKVLDLASRKSEEARKECLDLAKERASRLRREFESLKLEEKQKTLHRWLEISQEELEKAAVERERRQKIKRLIMQSEHEIFSLPKRLDWNAFKNAYEKNPRDFAELLSIKGMGKANVRALALISALIYGKEPSWKDPSAYSFAHGGKDGVPYPINKLRYEKSIQLLHDAISNAEIGKREKLDAIKRLNSFLG